MAATSAAALLRRGTRAYGRFVPPDAPATAEAVRLVKDFVETRGNLVVLTGAGVSTESGIPDYRSPNGAYSRGHRPVTFTEFVRSEATRKRYWARSTVAWELFSQTKENASHRALARLEVRGQVRRLITQNVDRLHQKAGSHNVIELHGSQFVVHCLQCSSEFSRIAIQDLLLSLNPSWRSAVQNEDPYTVRPDGDTHVVGRDYSTFNVPSCPVCKSGMLKPKLTFFGENVPKPIVESAYDAVQQCDGLLVVGSSLEVYSSFRFVRAAVEQNKPVGIVNIGPTRGDPHATFKVEARVGDLLARVAALEH